MGGTFKKFNGVECCDPSPVTIYFSGSLDGGLIYSYTPTSSFNNFTSSYYNDSSSFDLRITNIFVSQSNYVLTASFNNFTSSYYIDSSSFDQRILNVYASQSNYATTQSNTFYGDQTISGSIYVTGSIYANRLIVNVISSSIIYSSGSNIFGDSLTDTHEFTGSVYVTGGLQLNGYDVLTKPNVTGSATQVAFFTGPNTVNGDNGLWWDNINKRLGINDTTPAYNLHVSGSSFSEHTNYTLNTNGFGILGDLTTRFVGTETNQYLNAGVGGSYSIAISSIYSPQTDAKLGALVGTMFKSGNGAINGHISTIRSFAEFADSGSVTTYSGVRIMAPVQLSVLGDYQGTITDAVGLYIDDISGSSDIASNITNKIAINQIGSNDRNIFNGFVRVSKYTNGTLGVDSLGNLQVISGSAPTTSSTSSGSNVIISQNTGSYTAGFFNYTAASGSNSRAGTLQSVWNNGSVQYNEFTTLDIGNTSPVTMSVSLSGGNVVVIANVGASGWLIKAVAQFL